MVRFFTVVMVICIVWLWIIITWIHITIQGVNLNGYVYQPCRKYPSMVRKFFVYMLYPFCCKPITDEYEIKLVPIWEAYKRLLVATLLWVFFTLVVGIKEWENYRLQLDSERRRRESLPISKRFCRSKFGCRGEGR